MLLMLVTYHKTSTNQVLTLQNPLRFSLQHGVEPVREQLSCEKVYEPKIAVSHGNSYWY